MDAVWEWEDTNIRWHTEKIWECEDANMRMGRQNISFGGNKYENEKVEI